MARHIVPAAELILDQPVPVLDHGFVMLKDYMGSDAAIAEAARVSTAKQGATKTPEEDASLIRYLMNKQHTSPFEMVEFKFHCSMPIFVARQWIRHRTANVNEQSGRYSELPELTYVPEAEQIAYQSPKNKQGRGGAVSPEVANAFRENIKAAQGVLFEEYRENLGRGQSHIPLFHEDQYLEVQENGGISRELARINLPLSTYTQWYWKIDLHNLFRFLALRLDEHAQWEIRQYARAMAEMVQAVCPVAWQAFEDYQLDAVRLSGPEVRILREIHEKRPADLMRLSAREMDEFKVKLEALGLSVRFTEE